MEAEEVAECVGRVGAPDIVGDIAVYPLVVECRQSALQQQNRILSHADQWLVSPWISV
jgi:hypothetical protein|eukprot:COSAG03_NODE_42_length_17101_cov_8.739031_4_plen_58_part_00